MERKFTHHTIFPLGYLYLRFFWDMTYTSSTWNFQQIHLSFFFSVTFFNFFFFFSFSFFKLIYFYSVTIVCIFSPSLHPTPASPTSLPHLNPPPWFCPCVLYSSSYRSLSPLSPPHSPVAIVTMFLISMSLVIFCLLFSFVDYVPVKGEIIRYLSLTAWLISLSIMLSSSIHALAKGISSFFLSAAQNSIV